MNTIVSGIEPTGQLPPPPREHIAAPRLGAAMRVQNGLLTAARAFLAAEGLTELLLPIIGPVTDPGVRGSKQVDLDYYGYRYKLMTSGILYKQVSLLGFGAIFTVAPNVRMEPLETATTHRHLAEFHQLDVEIADASRDHVMDLAERLLAAMIEHVVTERRDDLHELGTDPARLTWTGGLDRVPHTEAVATLRRFGHPQDPATEIDWRAEELLSAQRDEPFFVTDYPKGSRGFYDRESRSVPGVLRNFDLLAPGGYGELASGGEREAAYERVITRMRESGENPAKYGWYLDAVRDGIPASAGFGIGVERLTRYVAGLDAAWQASPYPKVPGVAAP